jgi:transmembrane sensor
MSNIDHQALEWTAREAQGPLPALQQAQLDAWLAASPRHQGAYLRARAIEHTLHQVLLPETLRPAAIALSADAMAAAAPEVVEVAEAPAAVPARRKLPAWSYAGMAVAALLAATVAMYPALYPTLTPAAGSQGAPDALVLQTAMGELRNVPLADNSVASINSDTRLEVRMTMAERRIALQRGEAWFQVAKDAARPFVVAAGAVRVTAVGTAFAVQRQPGGADVVVTEGVVEVTRARERAALRETVVRVAAGEQAFVPEGDGAVHVRRQADAAQRQLAWREGMIMLNNDTLARAVAQFNRYNRRQILIADPALRNRTLVGNYRINEAEHFANDVRALLKVPVVVTAEQIRIGGK